MEHPEKALSAAAIKYLLTIAELCGKRPGARCVDIAGRMGFPHRCRKRSGGAVRFLLSSVVQPDAGSAGAGGRDLSERGLRRPCGGAGTAPRACLAPEIRKKHGKTAVLSAGRDVGSDSECHEPERLHRKADGLRLLPVFFLPSGRIYLPNGLNLRNETGGTPVDDRPPEPIRHRPGIAKVFLDLLSGKGIF